MSGQAELSHGPLRRIDPVIAALTILAFAVASYRLGTKSFWLDEAVSADHARLGLSGLWKVISGGDPNMGLYYALLHFWVRIFGSGETAIRSLTVVLGGLAVPVTALLGQRLFGRAAGLVAGLLLALSPFFVQYEQTARSYALVVLLVALSSYFFVAELDRPSRWTRVGYVLASVLAIYAHYFAAYVLLVQLLTLLAVKRRAALTREWLTAGVAVAVMCAPEAVFAVRAGTGGISWISKPSLSSLVHLPAVIAGGSLLASVLIILGCYGFLRALADGRRWRAGFVAAWCAVPVLLDFAVSELGHPTFVPYYLIVVLPAFFLLAAAGVVRLPGRATGMIVVLGLLVVLSAVKVSDWYRDPSQEDYRGATRYILGHERPNDGIIYYPAYARLGSAYYEALAGTNGPKVVRFQLGQTPPSRPARIWLLMRDLVVPPQQQTQVEHSITGAYERVGIQRSFHNITVILYRAR